MVDPEALGTRELVAAAKGGDESALNTLIERHLPALRAFVRAKAGADLRRHESCSDLVQTACRRALGALGDYEWRGDGSFRSWLFTIAYRRIQSAWRRRQFGDERDGSDAELAELYATICSPSRHASAREEVERVERALDELPAAYREVFVLSRFVGLSGREIAEQLGRSEAATRKLLSRALARFTTIYGA